MTPVQTPTMYAADLRSVAAAQRLRFFPLAPVAGRGAVLVEEGGRELVDLSASWGAAGVGYAHPRVVAAVNDKTYARPAAQGLAQLAPGDAFETERQARMWAHAHRKTNELQPFDSPFEEP